MPFDEMRSECHVNSHYITARTETDMTLCESLQNTLNMIMMIYIYTDYGDDDVDDAHDHDHNVGVDVILNMATSWHLEPSVHSSQSW